MTDLARRLQQVRESLCQRIEVGALLARNSTAHKWKSPWQALLLRESVAWRLQDLLEQSHTLSALSKLLGARILLRSAFETLAVLIYLNQSIQSVTRGNLDFYVFSSTINRLLLGSRDKSTPHESLNILKVLKSADKRYPSLFEWYEDLSETAHPNYRGMLAAYSKVDRKTHVTTFQNRWHDLHGASHSAALMACLEVFVTEYDDEWPAAFEALESWIEANDAELESSKPPLGDP